MTLRLVVFDCGGGRGSSAQEAAVRSGRRRFCTVVVIALVASMASAVASGAAAAPVLKVAPSKGLADFQQVTVTGSGFAAKTPVLTWECEPGKVEIARCDFTTLVPVATNAHGAFTLHRPVRRTISPGAAGQTVDCAAKAGCLLVAESSASAAASVAISFNPKIPPKKPTITVSPATKLTDHQLVTVTGKSSRCSHSWCSSRNASPTPCSKVSTPATTQRLGS